MNHDRRRRSRRRYSERPWPVEDVRVRGGRKRAGFVECPHWHTRLRCAADTISRSSQSIVLDGQIRVPLLKRRHLPLGSFEPLLVLLPLAENLLKLIDELRLDAGPGLRLLPRTCLGAGGPTRRNTTFQRLEQLLDFLLLQEAAVMTLERRLSCHFACAYTRRRRRARGFLNSGGRELRHLGGVLRLGGQRRCKRSRGRPMPQPRWSGWIDDRGESAACRRRRGRPHRNC
mmetsp:Transcript_125130/g.362025  ORF Transcript_125130/g.362025 Transcript_125130/m.362025 type:complete len:230 (+) Transcript_125130:685-1374(+)